MKQDAVVSGRSSDNIFDHLVSKDADIIYTIYVLSVRLQVEGNPGRL